MGHQMADVGRGMCINSIVLYSLFNYRHNNSPKIWGIKSRIKFHNWSCLRSDNWFFGLFFFFFGSWYCCVVKYHIQLAADNVSGFNCSINHLWLFYFWNWKIPWRKGFTRRSSTIRLGISDDRITDGKCTLSSTIGVASVFAPILGFIRIIYNIGCLFPRSTFNDTQCSYSDHDK